MIEFLLQTTSPQDPLTIFLYNDKIAPHYLYNKNLHHTLWWNSYKQTRYHPAIFNKIPQQTMMRILQMNNEE